MPAAENDAERRRKGCSAVGACTTLDRRVPTQPRRQTAAADCGQVEEEEQLQAGQSDQARPATRTQTNTSSPPRG